MAWDELCLPEWVSDSEVQQVEQLLPEFVNAFIHAAGPTTIARLTHILTRPLRPLYIDRTKAPPVTPGELTGLPFLPLLLCNPSDTSAPQQHDRRGWSYIQGAADDEAHWARGLAVDEWWQWRQRLVGVAGPRECEELADEIVAERKRRLERQENGEGKQGHERKEASEEGDTKLEVDVRVEVAPRAIGQSGLLIARVATAPTPQSAGLDAVLYLRVMHGKQQASALNRGRRQASQQQSGNEDDDEAVDAPDNLCDSRTATSVVTALPTSSSAASSSSHSSISHSDTLPPPTSLTIPRVRPA